MKSEVSRPVSTAELANYVVCPEAWRLKSLEAATFQRTPTTESTREFRRSWVKKQNISTELKSYARSTFWLLVLVVIVVFLLEQQRLLDPEMLPSFFSATRIGVPAELLMLLTIVGVVILVWDIIDRHLGRLRKSSGLESKSEIIGMKDSQQLPAEEYYAEELGLFGKADALVREAGKLIPLCMHPSARKIQDRHAIAIFAHMRLIEETQGIRPPYGILVLGQDSRRVRVQNSDDKQRWLETLIAEMQSIMDGVPAVPTPQYQKCKNCDVEQLCKFSAVRK